MSTNEKDVDLTERPLQVRLCMDDNWSAAVDVVGDVMIDGKAVEFERYGVYYRDDNGQLLHAWVSRKQLRNKPPEPVKFKVRRWVNLYSTGEVGLWYVTRALADVNTTPGLVRVEAREIILEWEVLSEG